VRRNSRRGGVIAVFLTLALIVGAVALIAALSGAFYFARNVRVTENGRGETRIETPFASLRVRESADFDPAMAGIPVYPGATRIRNRDGKHASFEIDLADEHKEFSLAAAEFTTHDGVSQVVDYYTRHMPGARLTHSHRGSVNFLSSDGGSKRVVAVRSRRGETRITLASVGEPAAN
jgi:hypothetical protein